MKEKDIRLLMEISPERESLASLSRGVELQRTKTVKAGKLLWCRSYPIWDTAAARDAKAKLETAKEKKGTSTAQKDLNAKMAKDRVIALINANFEPGDLMLTCTYADDRPPEDWKRAMQDMRNFLARVRRVCARRSLEAPVYVYVVEEINKRKGKEYHAHIIIKVGIGRDEMEALWEAGGHGHCNSKVIKDMEDGTRRMAGYLVKQTTSKARARADFYDRRHKWCASKGLKQPQETSADRKVSRRRVERIAESIRRDPVEARAHLERCYPGYRVLELEVKTSDWVSGAYVYAVMARKEEPQRGVRDLRGDGDHRRAGLPVGRR